MSVNKALDSILEGKLDEMRSNFSSALSTKAVEKLEERKIEIAQKYFGQMQEEVEQINEISPEKVLKAAVKARELAAQAEDEGNLPAQKAYGDQARRLGDAGMKKLERKKWNDGVKGLSSGKRTKSKLKTVKE
jgi:hypothetical protein